MKYWKTACKQRMKANFQWNVSECTLRLSSIFQLGVCGDRSHCTPVHVLTVVETPRCIICFRFAHKRQHTGKQKKKERKFYVRVLDYINYNTTQVSMGDKDKSIIDKYKDYAISINEIPHAQQQEL